MIGALNPNLGDDKVQFPNTSVLRGQLFSRTSSNLEQESWCLGLLAPIRLLISKIYMIAELLKSVPCELFNTSPLSLFTSRYAHVCSW